MEFAMASRKACGHRQLVCPHPSALLPLLCPPPRLVPQAKFPIASSSRRGCTPSGTVTCWHYNNPRRVAEVLARPGLGFGENSQRGNRVGGVASDEVPPARIQPQGVRSGVAQSSALGRQVVAAMVVVVLIVLVTWWAKGEGTQPKRRDRTPNAFVVVWEGACGSIEAPFLAPPVTLSFFQPHAAPFLAWHGRPSVWARGPCLSALDKVSWRAGRSSVAAFPQFRVSSALPTPHPPARQLIWGRAPFVARPRPPFNR